MGFMDGLKKLTQPYDDEDDFFEGADESFKTPAQISAAQARFEASFGDGSASAVAPEPAAKDAKEPKETEGGAGSLFGSLGMKKGAKPAPFKRDRFAAGESQVIMFAPKSFDEATEIMTYLLQRRSVIMSLEGIPTDFARRLLDFTSGIAIALEGKITPISAKTYLVAPQSVDLVTPGSQVESDGQYF